MTVFELFAFSVDKTTVRTLTAGGVAGIIVDWEYNGKMARQRGLNTEINDHGEQDLSNVRDWTSKRVVCRIDRGHDWSLQRKQIDRVIDLGGDEILLPMVQSVAEVTRVLDYLSNRNAVKVGILVETRAAVAIKSELAQLPLSRVYVGLNDLSIDSGHTPLFEPMINGLLAETLSAFSVPVGFGGLTLPTLGHPIPCRLLLAAMLDLDCSFSLLRRSFMGHTRGIDRGLAVRQIRQEIAHMQALGKAATSKQHRELIRLIRDQPESRSLRLATP